MNADPEMQQQTSNSGRVKAEAAADPDDSTALYGASCWAKPFPWFFPIFFARGFLVGQQARPLLSLWITTMHTTYHLDHTDESIAV